MDFNEEIQELFLRFMITDPDLWVRSNSILDVQYFHKNLKPVVKFLKEYSEKYNGLPTEEQIEAITRIRIKKIEKFTQADVDWFIESIQVFCKQRALEEWLIKGVDFVKRGEHGKLEQGLKDALLISLYKNLGTNYYLDPKGRLQTLKDNNGQIKTGWSDLDKKLYGGWNFGEIHMFAGNSGSGKSLFLQNLALNLSKSGLNVVYMTLELSEELVAMRIDCMLTGMSSKNVFKKMDDVESIVIKTSRGSGALIIKDVPQGSTTNDVRAYLKEIEIQMSIRPDVLIIDYLDLMFPNDRRIDPSNLFIKDKFVTEELRGLAREGLGIEHKLLCITASQLNRSSVEELEHNHAHIAGGKSKIDTADGVYSIHTSKSMREKGIYQIQFLKTRNSASTGDKITLAYDIDSMRISDYLEDAEDEPLTANNVLKTLKKPEVSNTHHEKKPTQSVIDLVRNVRGQ